MITSAKIAQLGYPSAKIAQLGCYSDFGLKYFY